MKFAFGFAFSAISPVRGGSVPVVDTATHITDEDGNWLTSEEGLALVIETGYFVTELGEIITTNLGERLVYQ